MSSFTKKLKNYYDKQKEYIEERINIKKEFDYVFENNTVELYDDGKKILTGEYEIVGLFNYSMSVWYWAYNVSFVNKKLMSASKNVRNFTKYIKDNYEKFDSKEVEDYYYYTSNGNFFITDEKINDILMLTLYINKGIWIFPIKREQVGVVQYIIITKITQL